MNEEKINYYHDQHIELIQCFYCKKKVNEEEITRTKAGAFACDNCFDPNDSEQQEQGRPNYKELKNSASIAESTQNTSNFNSSNSFTHEEEKASEKAIEINAEELNQAIEIPKELNII